MSTQLIVTIKPRRRQIRIRLSVVRHIERRIGIPAFKLAVKSPMRTSRRKHTRSNCGSYIRIFLKVMLFIIKIFDIRHTLPQCIK